MSRTVRAVLTAAALALAVPTAVAPSAHAQDVRREAELLFADGLAVDVFRPYERVFVADTGDGEELLTFRRGVWTTAGNAWVRSWRFGRAGDLPVVGDWDGDGLDEPGVVRGNRYFLASEPVDGGGDVRTFGFGGTRMVHGVVGDWDGDGDDEPVVATGAGTTTRFWFATDLRDGGGRPYAREWGRDRGDTFAAADVDGDGTDSLVLQRPSSAGTAPTYFVSTTAPAAGLRADEVLRYGRDGDVLFPGPRFVGDRGGDQIGVLREHTS